MLSGDNKLGAGLHLFHRLGVAQPVLQGNFVLHRLLHLRSRGRGDAGKRWNRYLLLIQSCLPDRCARMQLSDRAAARPACLWGS